jgi:hypothetical protein
MTTTLRELYGGQPDPEPITITVIEEVIVVEQEPFFINGLANTRSRNTRGVPINSSNVIEPELIAGQSVTRSRNTRGIPINSSSVIEPELITGQTVITRTR